MCTLILKGIQTFGVVVLEIVSGRSNSSISPQEESFYLLDWANSLKARGKLLELVDPRLELTLYEEEIARAINAALICTNAVAAERPSMSTVVSILEGRDGATKFVSESIISIDKTKADERLQRGRVIPWMGRVIPWMPWSGSSTSAADLYPVTPDTNYWEKRGL